MGRFLTADCECCGEPQISLTQCYSCKKGYCDSCYCLETIECSCGERVCFDCIGKCCDILERVNNADN